MAANTVPAPPPVAASERRIAPRFQPALGTVCRMGSPESAEPPVVGLVWNISATGVSMLMGNPPKAGSKMPAKLSGGSGGDGLAVTLRIVHVRPIVTGDFVLGAQFERPLEPNELQLFLAPNPPAERQVPEKTGR